MTNDEAIAKLTNIMHDDLYAWHPSILEAFRMAVDALRGADRNCISMAEAIDALSYCQTYLFDSMDKDKKVSMEDVIYALEQLPSAQPEQRYTEEELKVFAHGISLSLLSKRSAQHWQYDEDTATEIKFLERLYEKVGADMRGEQDEQSD